MVVIFRVAFDFICDIECLNSYEKLHKNVGGYNSFAFIIVRKLANLYILSNTVNQM